MVALWLSLRRQPLPPKHLPKPPNLANLFMLSPVQATAFPDGRQPQESRHLHILPPKRILTTFWRNFVAAMPEQQEQMTNTGAWSWAVTLRHALRQTWSPGRSLSLLPKGEWARLRSLSISRSCTHCQAIAHSSSMPMGMAARCLISQNWMALSIN